MPQSAGITIGLLGDVMLARIVALALREKPPEALWDPELPALAGSRSSRWATCLSG